MLNLMRTHSRHVALAALATILTLGAVAAAPQPAEARFVLGIGVPVYAPPYYPPPYYYAPPPVVYAPPPVYAPPVVMPAPAPAVVATPASQPYTAPNGQTCREYQSTAVINGVNQQTTGTACLQADGTWRIVN